jgi:cysteine desulfurase/selenocysteine lyase
MNRDVDAVRADFPVLSRTVNGEPLAYLDNAATTQTPRQVYDVFREYYEGYNANVHRGIHELSHEASVAYEAAHDRLAEFVGAEGREEMVFTKNTTESMNLVANGIGLGELEPGDAVVTTEMEHHASLVTWQQVAKRTGAEVRYVGLTPEGRLDLEEAKGLIDDDVEVVSVAHVSNVLGTVNPVSELADMAHEAGARVVVDGAQSVPTQPVDVGELGADFLAFSGHKMLGPTGIGCLYGRADLLEGMDPFLYGGEMIRNVTFSDASWNELPWKFEAGTPPIAEGIALAAAADYLDDLGMEAVRDHENDLAQYALRRLEARDDVETYGPPAGEARTGLVSFNVAGVHGHDLSSVLDDHGVAVRAGDHCTQPLHDRLDLPGSVRLSVYVYSTREEVDRLLDAIDGAREKVDRFMRSDRFHDLLTEHYERADPDQGLAEPTFVKHADETTCGDDGEFHVAVADDGTVEDVGFESRSCAVSRAVADILSERLTGKTLEEVAALDDEIPDLLEGQYPDLRRDCVEGPEDVIREAAAEYVERRERSDAAD